MISLFNNLVRIWQTVLVMSLCATIISGVIMLVKCVAGRRLSVRSHALIWLLFTVALVLPLSLISERLLDESSPAAKIWAPVSQVISPLIAEPIPVPGQSKEPSTPDQPGTSLATSGSETTIPIPSGQTVGLLAQLNPAQIIWLTAGLIWLAGSLTLAAIYTYSYVKTGQLVRRNGQHPGLDRQDRLAGLAKHMGLKQSIQLRLLPGAIGPFVFGIRRCQIVLPNELLGRLDEQALDTILIHELVHLKHRDHWLRLLQCLAQSLHWFNPVCWLALRWQQRDCEYYCDESTIRLVQNKSRASYAQLLLTTAALPVQNRDGQSMPPSLLAASFVESNLQGRIKKVLHENKASALVALASALAVVLAGCMLFPGLSATQTQDTTAPTTELTVIPSDTTQSTQPTSLITQPAPTPTLGAQENLALMAEQLTLVFKSGNTASLKPYIAHGLITDDASLNRKAEIIMAIYNQYIAPTGENHLEPYMNPHDTSGVYTMIAWVGDIQNNEGSGSGVGLYQAEIVGNQLKIKLLSSQALAEYLPEHQVERSGVFLNLDDLTTESTLQTFFSGLPYVRGESHTFVIDEDQPMQKHAYGRNLIDTIGANSQLLSGFSGTIVAMDLFEGAFTLSGKVRIGDTLTEVLAAWPILEDFCLASVGSEPAYDLILEVYPDTLVLLFKAGKLVQIHLQQFLD